MNKIRFGILLFAVMASSLLAFAVYSSFYKKPEKHFYSIDQILEMHGGVGLEVVELPKKEEPFHVVTKHGTQEGKMLSGSFGEKEYSISSIPGYRVGVVVLEATDGEIEILVVKYK